MSAKPNGVGTRRTEVRLVDLGAQNPVTIAQAKLIGKRGELTTDELADVENTVRM